MVDFIRPSERNKALGLIASLAGKAKEGLNAPGKIAGVGLGDLVMGQAPEFLDDYSYEGSKAFTGAGGIGGTSRPKEGMVDLAMLPGAAGLAQALRRAPSAVAKVAQNPSIIPETVDAGRRAFMGKTAALGAGAALAPEMLVQALRAFPSKAAPTVAKAAARAASFSLADAAALSKAFGKQMIELTGGHYGGGSAEAIAPERLAELVTAVQKDIPGLARDKIDDMVLGRGGKETTKQTYDEAQAIIDKVGGPSEYLKKHLSGTLPKDLPRLEGRNFDEILFGGGLDETVPESVHNLLNLMLEHS